MIRKFAALLERVEELEGRVSALEDNPYYEDEWGEEYDEGLNYSPGLPLGEISDLEGETC